MWPYILFTLRTYAVYITFPIAVAIGTIGYKLEGYFSDKKTPLKNSSIEFERVKRRMKEMENDQAPKNVASLKSMIFTPNSVLEKNLSPSLNVNSQAQ